MFERAIGEVEMNSFHEDITCYQYWAVGILDDSAVIPDSFDRGTVTKSDFFCEMLDEAKFAQR